MSIPIVQLDQNHEPGKPPPEKTNGFWAQNVDAFCRDIIGPARVVLANFIVFVLFFLADKAVLFLIEWGARDIRSRIAMVGYLFDGLEFFSTMAVAVYFIVSTITNLQSQLNINRKIEAGAGINE